MRITSGVRFRRRPTAKGVGLRVADSRTGNHSEDDFTPLETIQRFYSVFGRRSYLGFEGETSEPKGRDLLSNNEKENMKSVYLRNNKDKKKGVEYVMSEILGFYKECLELGPEYQTDQDESSSGASENHGGVTKYLMDMRAENFEQEKK
ncbi:hypothetical protein Tco_0374032 [Tanacetum coccineum]